MAALREPSHAETGPRKGTAANATPNPSTPEATDRIASPIAMIIASFINSSASDCVFQTVGNASATYSSRCRLLGDRAK
jgi:hypothetical protein